MIKHRGLFISMYSLETEAQRSLDIYIKSVVRLALVPKSVEFQSISLITRLRYLV